MGVCLGNKIKIMKKLAIRNIINGRKKGDRVIPNIKLMLIYMSSFNRWSKRQRLFDGFKKKIQFSKACTLSDIQLKQKVKEKEQR